MISSFATALAIHLGFSIVSGVFSIYTLFARDSQAALDACLQNANGQSGTTMQSCKTGLIIFKVVTVAIFVLIWLIQLC